MAFPDETLDLVVRAYIHGDWRDLSDRLDSTVTITRGGRDGASTAAAASCSLALRDDDGALTPLNPLGQWYPGVRRGVPVEVGYRRINDAFARTVGSGLGTTPGGLSWVAGAGYSVTPGVAQQSFAASNSRTEATVNLNLRDVEQVSDIKVPALATGAAVVTGHLARWVSGGTSYWLRLEFGLSGATALKLSRWVSGVHTELAALSPVPGLTYAAGTYLRLRSSVVGSQLGVRAWDPTGPEPAGWMLTTTDTAVTAPGRPGISGWVLSANSNAKPLVVSYANYQALVPRVAGSAVSYKPTLTPTADGTLVSTMQIQLGGTLRRLGQGSSPPWSALRRSFNLTSNLIVYHPLEDGAAVGLATSGILGRPPMTEIGKFPGSYLSGEADGKTVFGVEGSGGAASLVGLYNGGYLLANVPPTAETSWTWEAVARYDAGTDEGFDTIPFTIRQGARWEWGVGYAGTGTPGEAQLFLISGSTDGSIPGVTLLYPHDPYDGVLHHYRIDVVRGGADTYHYLYLDGELVASGTWVGHNSPTPDEVHANRSRAAGAYFPAVGHLAVTAPSLVGTVGDRPDATRAWVGEAAGSRLLRLAGESDESVQLVGDPAATMAMGPQRPDTLVGLLQECADADGGLLHESTAGALRYVTRVARYNRPVDLEIDLGYPYAVRSGESARVLTPVYDDQGLRNDVTATRTDGSSARVVDEDSVVENGRYDTELTVNVASDLALPDIASWAVHLGTVEEARYPQVPLDLAANPQYVDAWLASDVAARIRRINSLAPQANVPDQVVVGYTETLGPKRWDLTANCVPASPWNIAVVGGPTRVTAVGSTLAADLDPGDPTLSLASTVSNGVWTTNPARFPLPLMVGGDLVIASAISGAVSPQAVTISSWSALRSWPAGTPVQVAQRAIVAL